MRLSEVLLAKGIVSTAEVEQATARQDDRGGPLTDNLLALGLISVIELDTILKQVPVSPSSVEMTGLNSEHLLSVMVKSIRGLNVNTVAAIRDALKLPAVVVSQLLREAVDRRYLEETGSLSIDKHSGTRYQLTQGGRTLADEAMEQSQYIGPAPVSLDSYRDQIRKQAITGEHISPSRVVEGFADLVVSETYLRRLGPALNSGKSILLYGPAGNGKTTIAERIGKIFEDIIFIPYCVDVGGDIIRVLDPSVHDIVPSDGGGSGKSAVRREEIDTRWVACHRPFIVTGGELSLDMLDLSFNAVAKFYEMPIHLKAQGGTFVVDDFGRQLVRPEELLNRWIIPLEQNVDYLKLHSGKTVQIPVDQLTIFSTNMTPADLMDPAFLRRIPYKLEIGGPTVDEFKEIFRRVCDSRDVAWTDDDAELVMAGMDTIPGHQLACYQAKFLVDQVANSCRYAGTELQFQPDTVEDAISNLYAQDTEAP